MPPTFSLRPAVTGDVGSIQRLVEPLVESRVLLGKNLVAYFESVQEFQVAVDARGVLIGCGALHVLWEDLGEVRTLAVSQRWLHRGVGKALLASLEDSARALGLSRLFCLSFETGFFHRNGFTDMGEETVDPDVYLELVRSQDEGMAEFLDLARVKPNTLGNTRMVKRLA